MYEMISKGHSLKHVLLFWLKWDPHPHPAITPNSKCEAIWDKLDNLDNLQDSFKYVLGVILT